MWWQCSYMTRASSTIRLHIKVQTRQRLTLIANMVFRIRHRLENTDIQYEQYIRRMNRLRKSFDHWLGKGSGIVVQRYKGRCKKLQSHRQSLWLFLTDTSIPLTNNEAERRIRGSVIQRSVRHLMRATSSGAECILSLKPVIH